MRALLTRIQYQGTTLEQIKENQEAVKKGAEDQFPRTVLVENAISYNEAINCVAANIGRDIRQCDKSTISTYEIDRNGRVFQTPRPQADAIFDMA